MTRQLKALAQETLPEYLDDEAEELRRHAPSARLSALDLLAEKAVGRGDVDRAIGLWREAIRVDPVAQGRVRRAVDVLTAAERPLDVVAVLDEAHAALGALDLPLPDQLADLHEQLRSGRGA